MFQKIVNKLNDLRPKQLLILAGVAAFFMFLTIYFAMSLLIKEPVAQPESPPKAAPEQKQTIEMTPVVVAKVNIPPRTRIQDSMLQIKELPVDMVPEGAIKSFDDVKNVQIKVSIFAGDILTIQKVFSESGDEGFTGIIPADCRAVSISVNDLTGVAGFAKPGDRVDLLLAEKGRYSATTSLLLQNVPLLSVNQDVTGAMPIGENGVPTAAITNPSIATFALPPQDILKLISATKLGDIYMTLRPSHPRAAYVEEMEYTIDAIDAPKPVSQPTPVIPSNPLPQIPALEPSVPKFDIIVGDEIVQSSASTSKGASATGNSALPAIPSNGGNSDFTAPPPPNVPLTNSPIVNSFSENLQK